MNKGKQELEGKGLFLGGVYFFLYANLYLSMTFITYELNCLVLK
jgi:hypothetical protein